MTLLAPDRSSPPAQGSKSAWSAMVGASATALRSLMPEGKGLCPSERLDKELSAAIRRLDQAAFDKALGGIRLDSDDETEPQRQRNRELKGKPDEKHGVEHGGGRATVLSAQQRLLPKRSRALTDALESPSTVYLERLLAAGADPNALASEIGSRARLPYGQRLLHRAVQLDRPAAVWALMASGADASLRDPQGRSALIIAAKNIAPLCAQALIEHGAPLDLTDHSGRGALEWALGYHLKADQLQFSNATASQLDKSVLSLAARAPIAMALLEAGASASRSQSSQKDAKTRHQNGIGLPPLAAALRLQNLPLFKALLKNGADASWLLATDPVSNPNSLESAGPGFFLFMMSQDPARRAVIERAKVLASEANQARPQAPIAALASPEPSLSLAPHSRPILASRRGEPPKP